MDLPCASCSNDRRSRFFASERSAAAADGLLERILRKGSLQDILGRDHSHLVAEPDRMVVGAAWSNSRHTAPAEAEVRQEEVHREVHPGEGRDTGHTAHPGAEDQAAEDRDRWRPLATQRSYLGPISDRPAAGCPGQRAARTTVDICHEWAEGSHLAEP